jgi:tRNA(Arg) A34 adenosine deaminase TadA
MLEDKKFINRVIELSQLGMITNSGGPFGAVVVKNGELIAER